MNHENPIKIELVTVIIVNWNRCDDVLENINSLKNQDYPNFEIIVVDSGSTDDSVNTLNQIQGIHFISLDHNVGPAIARNIAMKQSSGDFLFFLDSDAYLQNQDSLTKLVNKMESDPTIGILGCKVLNYDDHSIDQWIYSQPMETHENQEFETYSFSTAGGMVRTDVAKKIAGFWEDLFMCNEEVDFSIRVLRAGYRILYFPDVSVYHKASPEGRIPSNSFLYYQIRNWIWIFYRYYPSWQCWKNIMVYICVYTAKGIANFKLTSSFAGIFAGLHRISLIHQFSQKLTPSEVRYLNSLNQGRRLKKWR